MFSLGQNPCQQEEQRGPWVLVAGTRAEGGGRCLACSRRGGTGNIHRDVSAASCPRCRISKGGMSCHLSTGISPPLSPRVLCCTLGRAWQHRIDALVMGHEPEKTLCWDGAWRGRSEKGRGAPFWERGSGESKRTFSWRFVPLAAQAFCSGLTSRLDLLVEGLVRVRGICCSCRVEGQVSGAHPAATKLPVLTDRRPWAAAPRGRAACIPLAAGQGAPRAARALRKEPHGWVWMQKPGLGAEGALACDLFLI